MAQEILWLYLLDRIGFQCAFVVFVCFENSVANHTELGVVVWIEGDLEKVECQKCDSLHVRTADAVRKVTVITNLSNYAAQHLQNLQNCILNWVFCKYYDVKCKTDLVDFIANVS